MSLPLQTHRQSSRYASPWSRSHRLRQLLWEFAWPLLCSWTPKPCNPWRLVVLRCFGATLHGRPFVHQRARIDHPWNLTLHHKACLGDRAHAEAALEDGSWKVVIVDGQDKTFRE